MKHILLIIVYSLFFFINTIAETLLSDDIGGRIFEASGNPYIIEQDVVIPKNTQTVIKTGCVFLFKSFTGINVYGGLLVEGTTEKPVIFTSINDANYNAEANQLPNPFDWNGIYITETAQDVKFRNFKLMYSVYGIKAKKENITIQSGFFQQNGQFNFTINNNILFVQDKISYDYAPQMNDPQPPIQDSQVVVPPKPEVTAKNPSKGKKAAIFSLLGVGAATGIPAIIFGVKTIQYHKEGDNVKTQIEWQEWEKNVQPKMKKTRAATIACGSVSGVTIPIALILLLNREKSKTVKKVTFNMSAGFQDFSLGITSSF